ncbi:MAG: hypothetical protein L6R39_002250 [Caloplaca ligustica]|nr:MAG: hypothetical protein L6R39_002250 [Caloplaca ligustica]
MPLEFRQVTKDSEFNEIVQCQCESYQQPLNSFFRLFRHDQSPRGFIELRDRQIREWKSDPTARWFKVVDTDIGDRVIGAAKWNVFTTNPYTDPQPVEADWWPEVLAMLFVHPEHRRRGAGRQLINWGVREADRLGLEAFIEATDDGKPAYEATGFTYMGTQYWESARRNPSEKWVELERYLQTPIHNYLMWRPKGGRFVEGETAIPWEK